MKPSGSNQPEAASISPSTASSIDQLRSVAVFFVSFFSLLSSLFF